MAEMAWMLQQNEQTRRKEEEMKIMNHHMVRENTFEQAGASRKKNSNKLTVEKTQRLLLLEKKQKQQQHQCNGIANNLYFIFVWYFMQIIKTETCLGEQCPNERMHSILDWREIKSEFEISTLLTDKKQQTNKRMKNNARKTVNKYWNTKCYGKNKICDCKWRIKKKKRNFKRICRHRVQI